MVFTVVATDNGQPEPFNATAQVTIMVFSPENFFDPVLDQTAYNVTLDENRAAGSVVLAFTVTDADRSGPAAEVGTATILGSDAQFFSVNVTSPNSGIITSK